MKMVAPWTRFYSHSCCLCCHVRTGTILLGVWYLIINAVVLLILLSALADPNQYHFSGSELGGEFEFMDDAIALDDTIGVHSFWAAMFSVVILGATRHDLKTHSAPD